MNYQVLNNDVLKTDIFPHTPFVAGDIAGTISNAQDVLDNFTGYAYRRTNPNGNEIPNAELLKITGIDIDNNVLFGTIKESFLSGVVLGNPVGVCNLEIGTVTDTTIPFTSYIGLNDDTVIIDEIGAVLNNSANPTISDSKIVVNSYGAGNQFEELSAQTKYFLRPYIVIGEVFYYGPEFTATTLAAS